ncbi:MAG: hypothetical protein KatS3mg003_2338 [Candidatus Nitrosocaldaceae archaeon]|nr:MAG: hypothetical protein KatS3mg003_2302 [Candidatus Nitrosocaldaceae archaeon]GIU72859.1 MAG: hypothetical protein KatS3mg003_2338 [Candidatus Nitrosocaldaceae archaeon]
MSKDELFSERMGFKPKKSIQYDDMDKELRTDLWNIFYIGSRAMNIRDFHICSIILIY